MDDDEARGQGEFVVGKLFFHKNDIGVVGQVFDVVHEPHDPVECVPDHNLVPVKDVAPFQDARFAVDHVTEGHVSQSRIDS
ncbi:MAG: hypothetical protein WB421_13685 [Terriglobales bacterium]